MDRYPHTCSTANKNSCQDFTLSTHMSPYTPKIVEIDVSDLGYGGILKQIINDKECLIRYVSGSWNGTQHKYSTVKKEILAIVLTIQKFQDDLINQKFILKVDCQSTKFILKKDVKNLASKQIFARWQALLSAFDFDIEYIKENFYRTIAMASNRERGRRGRGPGIQPSPTDIFRGIKASNLSSDLSLTYNSPSRPNHKDKYVISIISQPPDPNLLNIPSPSPSPNLSLTNKFSHLQTDSPSFKTVVSAHLSPQSIKQEKLAISKQNLNMTSSPSSSKPPSSSYPYIPKPFFDRFCSMEMPILLDQYFDEPKKLADTLIDLVFFRIPEDHLKRHIFYEFILVDTDSIYISDVFDQVDKEKIIFRKIKLCKILT
ncbi:hypothetical protein Dsin_027591 [Dipteronia sinensis]|uniref:Reverse transcriptase RNase H-like domain-containing protein n=1 Tax=Dipteronia sinensis TaxID=43782 RepID=A0AAD9ZPP3_9ROSI|nr:hypothetical protein Dsin_027591 [Dipteronia sinensis]